jgi:MoxR-like ATPase
MPDAKIGWLTTEEGFCKVEVLGKEGGFAKVKRPGTDQLEAIPLGTPFHGFFPALWEQDDEPKAWRYKGRCLPLVDVNGFSNPNQAKALLGTNQSFDSQGQLRPYVFQPHTSNIIDGILLGDHVFLVGPKGVGKTSCVEQVAARVGQPVIRINFTGQVAVSDLVGNMGFGPQGTFWNDGPVITAMRAGYWLLLDEFDFGDPSVMSIFHPILEAHPSYCLKENNGEVVVAHPRFRVFATGNSIGGDKDGQYVGTQALNAALLDRFTGHGQVVKIESMSSRQEREVVRALLPDVPWRIAKRACDFAADMRTKHLKGLSTREVVNWVRKIMLVRDAARAARLTFLAVVQNEEVQKGVEEAIRARFGSRVIIGRCILDGSRMPPPPRAKAPRSAVAAKTPTGPEAPEPGAATVVAAPAGARASSDVTDPEEIKAIWRDYKNNGGAGLTYEDLEAKYGLKSKNGMTAYRVVKKYEAMMGEAKAVEAGDADEPAKKKDEEGKAEDADEGDDDADLDEDADADEEEMEAEEAED